ncbi:MAG: helix-turn-helix domain-containing protein [Henriciella sp.]|nr:helix-turn-helix domain-containing protein [Henriciella sp.]
MKLHFTTEWLRSHIKNDPDIECDAGFPLLGAEPLRQFVGVAPHASDEAAPEQKTVVLYQLVRQLRRRDGLTKAQLADKIRIEAREIESIEAQPEYIPKPRTVHQLAQYLGVPAKAVEQLTSAAHAQNDNLAEAAHRFAASSDDLSKLSKIEKKRFDDFVKVLASFD